jgi:carbon storage regulator CsrA
MLVLSRKLNERILIPDCELAITVVAIQGKAVRLGVSAPAGLAVVREELLSGAARPGPAARSQSS